MELLAIVLLVAALLLHVDPLAYAVWQAWHVVWLSKDDKRGEEEVPKAA